MKHDGPIGYEGTVEHPVCASVCLSPGRPGRTQKSRNVVGAIATLSSKQRAHLRSLAHDLRPIVHIGKDGITGAAVTATKEALNTRELLKVRVLDAAPSDAREAARRLAEQIDDAQVVHVIGHVFVLYRPFPEHPKIRLPA